MTNIDTKEFRNALGAFVTGVTIVTTLSDANANGDAESTPVACTANSFASVSLDPPLVLWSIARSAQSFDAFEKAEHFAVHILHSAQVGLSNLCATKNADKFGEISWHPGLNGVPIFDDYNTCFQCSVENKYDGGDHVIIVGRVHKFDSSDKAKNAKPLVFYRGAYAGLG
ncbi:MAG: flavin reductase family protein [Gammaproteobacteria bacterium]|nr:flavin reductase family protein [Gammaproteobacteria bacterium]